MRRKRTYTWWYRRGKTPREINITNVAAEKDFHASRSGSSADDRIKPLENQFADYVDKLRKISAPAALSGKEAASLVVHLDGKK